MRLIFFLATFYFISTALVEGLIISFLIGAKVGYLIARNQGRGHVSRGRSYGGRGRWGRSIAESEDQSLFQLEQMMIKAATEDNDDCAKSIVCQVNAKPILNNGMEAFIYDYFGGNSKDTAMLKALMPNASQGLAVVDTLSPTVQFELAAQVGRVGGLQQCQKVYAQCPLTYNEILPILEGQLATPQPQQLE